MRRDVNFHGVQTFTGPCLGSNVQGSSLMQRNWRKSLHWAWPVSPAFDTPPRPPAMSPTADKIRGALCPRVKRPAGADLPPTGMQWLQGLPRNIDLARTPCDTSPFDNRTPHTTLSHDTRLDRADGKRSGRQLYESPPSKQARRQRTPLCPVIIPYTTTSSSTLLTSWTRPPLPYREAEAEPRRQSVFTHPLRV